MIKSYPDELTFDEFDDMPWIKSKQFGLEVKANIEEIKNTQRKSVARSTHRWMEIKTGCIPKVSDL
ncbi:MAG: hypothetical protein ACREAR_07950 [Nitrosotalea sp.]